MLSSSEHLFRRRGISYEIHTCIEFIHAANPLEASLGNIVQGHQVEVSRNAVDGADADFMESLEEILGNSDGRFEVLYPDVCHVGVVCE
jgi:hypothetical protein